MQSQTHDAKSALVVYYSPIIYNKPREMLPWRSGQHQTVSFWMRAAHSFQNWIYTFDADMILLPIRLARHVGCSDAAINDETYLGSQTSFLVKDIDAFGHHFRTDQGKPHSRPESTPEICRSRSKKMPLSRCSRRFASDCGRLKLSASHSGDSKIRSQAKFRRLREPLCLF